MYADDEKMYMYTGTHWRYVWTLLTALGDFFFKFSWIIPAGYYRIILARAISEQDFQKFRLPADTPSVPRYFKLFLRLSKKLSQDNDDSLKKSIFAYSFSHNF